MLMYDNLERKPAAPLPSALPASRDNGAALALPTAALPIRRHQHSRSNSAGNPLLVATANNSGGSNNNDINTNTKHNQSGGGASTGSTGNSSIYTDRNSTAAHTTSSSAAARPRTGRPAGRGVEGRADELAAQAPSPGSKRTSSVADAAHDHWSRSSPSHTGEERAHKRRSSFARRLSFGTHGGGGSSSGGSSSLFNNNTSPTRRRNAKEARRRSPDSSPQQQTRRSFHSPPPPGGTSRASSQLPPISTLPSLPKLSFEPLLSSAGGTRPTSPTLLEPLAADRHAGAKTRKPSSSPKRRRDASGSRARTAGHHEREDGAFEPGPGSGSNSNSNSSSSRQLNLPASTYRPTSDRGPGAQAARERGGREPSPGNNSSGGSATPSRRRDKRERDKKAMLSRALQKANTAVLLDNAQNFEGAVDAYGEACSLLQHVMEKSSTDEDRRKLDAIYSTYMNRMHELYELDTSLRRPPPGKSLPPRPDSDSDAGTRKPSREPLSSDEEEHAVIETATISRIANDRSITTTPQRDELGPPSGRESTLSSAIKAVESSLAVDNQTSFYLHSPIDGPGPTLSLKMPMDSSYMPPPLSPRPPPSPTAQEPQRTASQERLLQPPAQQTKGQHSRDGSGESMSWLDTIDESGSSCRSSMHSRSSTGELRRKVLTSRTDRPYSQGTEADFDAALDAAVEAAYAEGMEPHDKDGQLVSPGLHPRPAPRDLDVGAAHVHEGEHGEGNRAARSDQRDNSLQRPTGRTPPTSNEAGHHTYAGDDGDDDADDDDDDGDAEEEERLLDEMTREYMLDGFDFGLQNKSALPRQSDGSEFGSTWNSSRSSNRTTGTTAATALSSLGTVAEGEASEKSRGLAGLPTVTEASGGQVPKSAPRSSTNRPSVSGLGPAMPPPNGALPQLPPQQPGVRSRRMSGQNAKQLKIETSVADGQAMQKKPPELPPLSGSAGGTPTTVPHESSTSQAGLTAGVYQPSSDAAATAAAAAKLTAPVPDRPTPSFATSPADTTVTVSPATPGLMKTLSNDAGLIPPSPGVLNKGGRIDLRKNKSSLSLKASRQLSLSSPDVSDGGSIATPMSTTFSHNSARTKGSMLVNPSFLGERSQTSASGSTVVASNAPLPALLGTESGLSAGGMHLFDSDMHSPLQPGSPNPLAFAPPAPLEPCPCSHLLRPFWLMRCLYQTLAHPRGGYLSTKLFVPREIWKTKGLKLKSVDDKVANCDLLSAALGKLARVDMIDADAVLEEMQSLELVLDQVQATLQKKLGSDVGASGAGQLFKDAPPPAGEGGAGGGGGGGAGGFGAGAGDTTGTRTSGGDRSRSYLSSWRKLRSKNSAAGLTGLTTSVGGLMARRDGGSSSGVGGEESKNAPTMATVPMTSLPNIRFTKREPEKLDFGGAAGGFGALGHYMESLARLCDAVQIIDTIARQVEDPGLKAASQTHVGLELCTRHASEFFGFYICRFALSDVGIMLDKFIKRSSEWVLV